MIFTAKSEKGSFKGYSITQFDENTKKIENRGSISPENVVYKRCSDGKYACIYNDEQAGGEVIPYHMENISKEEYESRLKNDSKKTRVQRRNR